MKNLFVIILIASVTILQVGCNLFDDECSPDDFVGSYTLDVTTVSDDCTSEFSESISVTASGNDAISVDGAGALPIQGCSAFNAISGPLGGLASGDKVSIDGSVLRFQKNTCSASYNKN